MKAKPPDHLQTLPPGWTPARWAAELRRQAECCRGMHPKRADELEAAAERFKAKSIAQGS